MCGETADQIAVYLNSGVVVVHIVGGWSDAALRAIQSTVTGLMAAGHFEIVAECWLRPRCKQPRAEGLNGAEEACTHRFWSGGSDHE